MVVDDVPLASFFITSALKAAGFTNVFEYSDSAEAWNEFAQALLRDEEFDLVITDLNMPELDGMDFLKQIKSDHMSESTPVIIASADHDPIIIREAYESGAYDYFTKPIDTNALIESIKKLFV
jgi:two-component system chemotaxis response regulator CheY